MKLFGVVWILLLVSATAASGQNRGNPMRQLIGLDGNGVLLTGDLKAPVIQNHTKRKILGYTLSMVYANGQLINRTSLLLLTLRNGQSKAIPPGGERRADPNDGSSGGLEVMGPSGPSTLTRISLDSVIFDDGEFVGPDIAGAFENVSARIAAETDLHQRVIKVYGRNNPTEKDQLWADLERLAKRSTADPVPVNIAAKTVYRHIRRARAEELVRIRQGSGEAAARALANQSAIYPTLWRQK